MFWLGTFSLAGQYIYTRYTVAAESAPGTYRVRQRYSERSPITTSLRAKRNYCSCLRSVWTLYCRLENHAYHCVRGDLAIKKVLTSRDFLEHGHDYPPSEGRRVQLLPATKTTKSSQQTRKQARLSLGDFKSIHRSINTQTRARSGVKWQVVFLLIVVA